MTGQSVRSAGKVEAWWGAGAAAGAGTASGVELGFSRYFRLPTNEPALMNSLQLTWRVASMLKVYWLTPIPSYSTLPEQFYQHLVPRPSRLSWRESILHKVSTGLAASLISGT